MNTGEPGWGIQQGQAVWRPDRSRTELAGELVIATHSDGRSLVQFTKTPLPLVTAQIGSNAWRVEFGVQQRVFSGRGKAPKRVLWLYLPRALQGAPIPPPLTWTRQQGNWILQNPRTGESIEGYLTE